jgi:hypothetical protein
MTTEELINTNITDNNTFFTTPEKMREVLLQMLSEYISLGVSVFASEKQVHTLPGVSIDYELLIEHSLNSQYVEVVIFLDGQIIPNTDYSVIIQSENEVLIIKPTGMGWNDAEIIIKKIH